MSSYVYKTNVFESVAHCPSGSMTHINQGLGHKKESDSLELAPVELQDEYSGFDFEVTLEPEQTAVAIED